MQLSDAEEKYLEYINRELEDFIRDGSLRHIWHPTDSLNPTSPILKLAENLNAANEIIRARDQKDELTRLWNRTTVFEFLEQAIGRIQGEYTFSVVVAYFDIDKMKYFNDMFGIPRGEETLQKIAKTIASNLQPFHLVGRTGGDEFLAVLNASMDETKAFMEKIQTEIAALIYTVGDPEIRATLSIVLTQVTREDTVESCMTRVEGGIQHAKNTRRNDIWIV
jgi:diguanylate cyclase